MSERGRRRRVGDLPIDLRTPHDEEMARVARRVLPYVVVSLVLQCLVLVVGARTLRQMHRSRHLRGHLLRRSAGGPLLGLLVLNLASWLVNRRVYAWVRHVHATTST